MSTTILKSPCGEFVCKHFRNRKGVSGLYEAGLVELAALARVWSMLKRDKCGGQSSSSIIALDHFSIADGVLTLTFPRYKHDLHGKRAPPEFWKNVTRIVLKAVRDLLRCSVWQSDVKPANIFVRGEGETLEVVLADLDHAMFVSSPSERHREPCCFVRQT